MNPQEKFAQQLLAQNLRADGREPLEARKRTALFLAPKGMFYVLKVTLSSAKETPR